jgi:hypothetical protein
MKVFITAALTAIFLAGAALAPADAQTLRLDRTAVAPGERITVTFSGAGGYASNAWIGIIPSGVDHGREAVNDQYDLTYQYLRGKPSGQLAFTAPVKPGPYDFRMHDTDNNGREVASVSFTVTQRAEGEAVSNANLRLDRTVFSPSASASVHFTASGAFPRNAWVGIIPSHVAHGSEAVNDGHDLTYQYLNGRTSGTLTFTVPKTPGEYDFRMHDSDNNGREVASVSFSVALNERAVGLNLEKGVFSPMEEIRLGFTAPEGLPGDAWVGIIPSRVEHGSESVNDQHDLTYQYLRGRTGGVLTFTAPAAPGGYDFRMHDTDSNGRELTSVSFRVEN